MKRKTGKSVFKRNYARNSPTATGLISKLGSKFPRRTSARAGGRATGEGGEVKGARERGDEPIKLRPCITQGKETILAGAGVKVLIGSEHNPITSAAGTGNEVT